MTSSLTTALEEMTINNEQLRREVDDLKTQLRTNNDVMKDENKQLKSNIDKQKDEMEWLKANNDKQRDQNRRLYTEVDMMKAENHQLKVEIDDLRRHICTNKSQPLPRTRQQPKVSQWSGMTRAPTIT